MQIIRNMNTVSTIKIFMKSPLNEFEFVYVIRGIPSNILPPSEKMLLKTRGEDIAFIIFIIGFHTFTSQNKGGWILHGGGYTNYRKKMERRLTMH